MIGPRFLPAEGLRGEWRPPRVFIITWCGEMTQLWGTVLTFRTLRIGFPKAPVTVIDNASLEEARPAIERAAKDAGCEYVQRSASVPHGAILGDILARVDEPIVFLDPDVILWESCEGWTFGQALIAGRLIPMYEGRPDLLLLPRLHTSFLWIPRPALVRAGLQGLGRGFFASPDVFLPLAFQGYMVRLGKQWLMIDTGAALYSYFAGFSYEFGPSELDAYDHIFSATHPSAFNESSDPYEQARLHAHRVARDGDYRGLRGLWRVQEQYFQSQARDFAALAAAGAFSAAQPLRHLLPAADMAKSDE